VNISFVRNNFYETRNKLVRRPTTLWRRSVTVVWEKLWNNERDKKGRLSAGRTHAGRLKPSRVKRPYDTEQRYNNIRVPRREIRTHDTSYNTHGVTRANNDGRFIRSCCAIVMWSRSLGSIKKVGIKHRSELVVPSMEIPYRKNRLAEMTGFIVVNRFGCAKTCITVPVLFIIDNIRKTSNQSSETRGTDQQTSINVQIKK